MDQNRDYLITDNWLIGFTEAEGSFIGGRQPCFSLSQHVADRELMEAIARYIGHGKVRLEKRKDGRVQAVLSIYDKTVLRDKLAPLFEGKLLTLKKIKQFNKWKEDLKIQSAQLDPQGLINIDPEWLVGFTDGDGSFYPMIHKAKDYRCGFQVQLVFDLAQEEGEKELLTKISDQYFKGEHKWAKSKTTEHMRITKLPSIINYVEPFFARYQLQTRKRYDFILWQEMLEIMKRKEHLTLEGVNKIKKLVLTQKLFRGSGKGKI